MMGTFVSIEVGASIASTLRRVVRVNFDLDTVATSETFD